MGLYLLLTAARHARDPDVSAARQTVLCYASSSTPGPRSCSQLFISTSSVLLQSVLIAVTVSACIWCLISFRRCWCYASNHVMGVVSQACWTPDTKIGMAHQITPNIAKYRRLAEIRQRPASMTAFAISKHAACSTQVRPIVSALRQKDRE